MVLHTHTLSLSRDIRARTKVTRAIQSFLCPSAGKPPKDVFMRGPAAQKEISTGDKHCVHGVFPRTWAV